MNAPIASAQARLGALMQRLDVYRLDVQIKPQGLRVTNPFTDGCCEDNPEPSDTITCGPRPDDGGRLWFFHSWGEPISEADKVIDASVVIASKLGAC
ncbi:hypothetical protein [Actinomadura geliboluensis]|uniref:hypothetical protein n=1 Tax=Actinomadura geliboluensis TaxID=882440 RepID=UPI00369A25DF